MTDLFVVSMETGRKRRLTRTRGVEGDTSWSPNGETVAYDWDRRGNQDIYSMRPDGSERMRLTHSPRAESRPDWSPDGKRILFIRQEPEGFGELYVMAANGRRERPVLTGEDVVDAKWSPSGARIGLILAAGFRFKVYVVRVDGSHLRRLVRHDRRDYLSLDW